jgi:hypothetical protein
MSLGHEPRAERASVPSRPSRLTDPGLVDPWFERDGPRASVRDGARRGRGAHGAAPSIGDAVADAWFV